LLRAVSKAAELMRRASLSRNTTADTWVKMPDGKWQCVASQDSPVKK
jgi:hypothetical protein